MKNNPVSMLFFFIFIYSTRNKICVYLLIKVALLSTVCLFSEGAHTILDNIIISLNMFSSGICNNYQIIINNYQQSWVLFCNFPDIIISFVSWFRKVLQIIVLLSTVWEKGDFFCIKETHFILVLHTCYSFFPLAI